MPWKWQREKVPMPKGYDRRRKLTDEDRASIKRLYGSVSQRMLAAMFGVSRRLIQFVGCPEKHKKNLEARKARGGWKAYYDKGKNTETQREHRNYKNRVLKGLEKES